MKKILTLLVVGGGLLMGCSKPQPAVPIKSIPVRYIYGHIPVDSFHIDTFYVKMNETLGTIFAQRGATFSQIRVLSEQYKKHTPFYTIHPRKPYMVLYHKDSLKYYIYEPNAQEAYIIGLHGDSLSFEHYEHNVTSKLCRAEITIESSLWNAIVDKGLPAILSLDLYDIYAWTIDFFGLQKGDCIIAYYEEKYVGNTFVGLGRIYASNFYHGGKWHEAYFFDDGTQHSYYDTKGNSLKKSFLKAPLNYRRISSRFSYARKHPIFKVYRPHLGVDYAAPTGTPVVSIGDGVVINKSYSKGGGNTLKIRHNSAYTTGYMHLRGYAKGIRVGTVVKQGQVIGYVGTTGYATGPHLDFRVWRGGVPINPLTIDAPSVKPIPKDIKPQFDSVVNVYTPFIQPTNLVSTIQPFEVSTEEETPMYCWLYEL